MAHASAVPEVPVVSHSVTCTRPKADDTFPLYYTCASIKAKSAGFLNHPKSPAPSAAQGGMLTRIRAMFQKLALASNGKGLPDDEKGTVAAEEHL
eukprot:478600-Pelagomonas_calceolata.AAC.1